MSSSRQVPTLKTKIGTGFLKSASGLWVPDHRIMLVTPEHQAHAQSLLVDSCGDRVKLGPTGFRIAGATYEAPTNVVVFSCHRAGVPGSVVTVLYAIQPAAATKVARLLFFYGWHSVVIFTDGAVAQRDVWQVPQTIKEVRLNAQQ